MDARVKRILVVAALVVLPAGGALAIWYWYRTRKPVTALPWLAGLIGTSTIDAAMLADKHGIGLNHFALAMMMQSEGRAPSDRIARAWVALNNAKRSGKSLYQVITARKDWHGKDPKTGKAVTFKRTGFFGAQSAGGAYATTKEPTAETIQLAADIINGKHPDPTGGALRFVDVKSFGKQAGTRSFAEVDAKWQKEGFKSFRVAGTASDFLVYRKVV